MNVFVLKKLSKAIFSIDQNILFFVVLSVVCLHGSVAVVIGSDDECGAQYVARAVCCQPDVFTV